MGKRLTDCAKWDKVWFRKLNPVHKCFWVYICDRCDHVGIWEVDFEMASLYIGAELNPEEIKTVFNKQYLELNCGSKWLVKDFLLFQYGPINESNKMFNTIKSGLDRYSLKMGDIWGINGGMVKVKVTVKEKVKDIKGVIRGNWDHFKNDAFGKAFDDFLDMRQKIKKPATDRAQEIILKDLHKYPIETAIAMLEQSIVKSWQTVYPLKTSNLQPKIILTKQQQSNLQQLEAITNDK